MNKERSSLPTPLPTNAPAGRKFGAGGALLGAMMMLAATTDFAVAQSDNFDSGTLSSAWTKYEFFGQSYTFPTVGTGKGLRIQANPVPSQAPAAAAISQATVYTDFYVAVDIVNWDDSLHQVTGVTARIGDIGAGTTRGYLFTHDRGDPGSSTSGDMDIVRIDGENPTSLQT